ncbi:MAG: hypothetical protein J6C91_09250, partial [Muribaculaceae bacterium]|nr:hypothetical protein [Muribaculaceae bacterium]
MSIPVGDKSIRKEEGENEFVLHFLYKITVKSYYILDDTPRILPEAYTTKPLSRVTFDLSGHYELVNV